MKAMLVANKVATPTCSLFHSHDLRDLSLALERRDASTFTEVYKCSNQLHNLRNHQKNLSIGSRYHHFLSSIEESLESYHYNYFDESKCQRILELSKQVTHTCVRSFHQKFLGSTLQYPFENPDVIVVIEEESISLKHAQFELSINMCEVQ
jgi:hypothetical protein